MKKEPRDKLAKFLEDLFFSILGAAVIWKALEIIVLILVYIIITT